MPCLYRAHPAMVRPQSTVALSRWPLASRVPSRRTMWLMSAKSRRRPGPPPAADAPDLVAQFGGHLLTAAGPLEAELLAATVLALPYREGLEPELAELFVATLLDTAGQNPSPAAAAMLRAIAAVAPPHQRRQAVAALGQVTAAGFYPPEWAAEIGRATPGQAWRRYDVYGDAETITVSYGYGQAEHAVLVQVDKCREPTVLAAMVVGDMAALRSVLEDDPDPLVRVEPIGPADARARLTAALGREPELAALTDTSLVSLPIARTRLRRLPAEPAAPPRTYDAADRSAAVAEFLASPHAAEAGEEKAARFWAEVLAGYSAYIPGDPPGRIGTGKLSQMLLSYVPNSFALTDEQRTALPAAVTAWTRWAAQRQQLDQPALSELDARLPQVLARFDEAYGDPDAAAMRSYLADVSATTADAAALAEALNRRALAVPLPDERGDESLSGFDAAQPANRRALVEREFGECSPPDGMSQPDFLAAAVRVSEQLWHDDPPELWQRAQRLSAAGTGNHDIIHQLVAG